MTRGARCVILVAVLAATLRSVALGKALLVLGSGSAEILGDHVALGQGVRKDPRHAAFLYWIAAMTGSPSAQRKLASYLQTGEGVGVDVREAVKWYRRGAGQGDIYSEIALGWLCENG